MSLRGLLVLVGLLAAAVATLFWIDHRGTPNEAASPDTPLMKAFTEDSLRAIELGCEGSTVILRREPPQGWRIVQPFEAEADPRRVHEVVAALQDARVRRTVAEGTAALQGFGLAPAACTVRLTFGPGSDAATLRLGRGSPVGTERYAAGADDRVVLTDGSLHSVLARGAEALREKRLFPVDAEAITRIELRRPEGRLVVVRGDRDWRLEAPLDDAASAAACTSLARAVASLEVTDAASTRAPSSVRAERRVELAVATKGEPAPRVAYVATLGIGGTRLAWREGGQLAGLVSDAEAGELARLPDSFRDARITSFSLPDVRGVSIDRGSAHLRVTRAGEGKPWTGVDGAAPFSVDGARVDALVDRLRALTASGFEPGPAGTKSTGTIAVAGEHGELARLAFAPLPRAADSDDELVAMTTPSRPGVVFRVPALSLGPIPATAADLMPPEAATPATAGGS